MDKLDETKKITKDMTIGSILENYPDKAMKLSEIMAAAGLHCVGCGAATFETLEQGVIGHGFDENVLNKLVEDLNSVFDKNEDIEISDEEVITLDKSAVDKIKEIRKSENKEGFGLRVTVLAGGCAGYSYALDLKEGPEEDDMILEEEGIKIFIDKDSAKVLKGTKIKYVESLEESGFKFENPNISSSCGCGKSFN